jgi:hypothetical protein
MKMRTERVPQRTVRASVAFPVNVAVAILAKQADL